MRKIIFYFISWVLVLSCARQAEKHANNANDGAKVIEFETTSTLPTEESYLVMIKQKLQDQLDRENLVINHPEFRIYDTTKTLFANKTSLPEKEIKRIVLIDTPKQINDSVTKLITQVYFANNKTDTILTYIQTSVITLDNTTFKTSEITFKRQVQD